MNRYDDSNGKVFVGNLPKDAREKEVESAFTPFGVVKSVWVARNPPGFGFVHFEDPRDAKDAVKMLDGTNVCGVKVKVELSNGKGKTKPWESDSSSQQGKKFDPDDKCFKCGIRGHYAYDCNSNSAGGYADRRSRSRSPPVRRNRGFRSRSRSLKRSRSRSFRRSRSRSFRRSRSRSNKRSPLYKTSTTQMNGSSLPDILRPSSPPPYRRSPPPKRAYDRPPARYEGDDRGGGGMRDRGYSRPEKYDYEYKGRNAN